MSKFGKVNRNLIYHHGPPAKTWPDREDLPPDGAAPGDRPAGPKGPEPGEGDGRSAPNRLDT